MEFKTRREQYGDRQEEARVGAEQEHASVAGELYVNTRYETGGGDGEVGSTSLWELCVIECMRWANMCPLDERQGEQVKTTPYFDKHLSSFRCP